MTTFGMKYVDTLNKSKTHDYNCNFSPMTLKGDQMVYL